ncbi:hypothetical protein B566_EDAN015617 [Ephemera danica]|nr:hypothetical protein B566_EDAN015617 [Ephemera danica]
MAENELVDKIKTELDAAVVALENETAEKQQLAEQLETVKKQLDEAVGRLDLAEEKLQEQRYVGPVGKIEIQVLTGMRDMSLKEEILQIPDLTYEKCVRKAKSAEAAHAVATQLHGAHSGEGETSVHKVNERYSKRGSQYEQRPTSGNKLLTKKLYGSVVFVVMGTLNVRVCQKKLHHDDTGTISPEAHTPRAARSNLNVGVRSVMRTSWRNSKTSTAVMATVTTTDLLAWRPIYCTLVRKRPSCRHIKLNKQELPRELLDFRDVFAEGLGTCKIPPVHLDMMDGVQPVFRPPRPVPYAKRARVNEALELMVRDGAIAPVTSSPWATPTVNVEKTDGTIRVCGDYSGTVNPRCNRDVYPMPSVNEILTTLSGGTTWEWGTEHQEALDYVKQVMSSDIVLVHYDEKLPLVLACDASSYGVGAVLSHLMPDQSERPISHASRTLRDSEKNYAQIDREGLSIVFGVRLFRPDKPLPDVLSPRIVRWVLLLSNYQYTLQFRPGSRHGNADLLSRIPRSTNELDEIYGEPRGVLLLDETKVNSPLSVRNIEAATKIDPVLSAIYSATQRGGDFRMTKMKLVARSYVWWPRLDNDIEELCGTCEVCCQTARLPPKATPMPWSTPPGPWRRIHIDFAGPDNGKSIFIAVDAFSHWIEAQDTGESYSAKTAIVCLRGMFATHGIPDELVSDNAPAFRAEEFRDFMDQNLIIHIRVVPYQPASNGLAERAVQTIKSMLHKVPVQRWKYELPNILLALRSTPSAATGRTPAELMFGRNVRTLLDRLHPYTAPQNVSRDAEAQQAMISQPSRVFAENDVVWYRNYRGNPKWLKGTVIKVMGPRNYEICTDSEQHIAQLRVFTDLLKNDISLLHLPELSFFKDFIESFGGRVPLLKSSPTRDVPKTEMPQPPKSSESAAKPEEMEEELIESDIELDNTGVIEPDTDDHQQMGDENKEVTEEDMEKSDEKKREAISAFSEGEFERAVEIYTEAILLNPGSALLYAKRGQCYIKLNKPNACIRDCTRALEMNPDSAAAYKFRGRAHRLLGNWAQAAQDLRDACKIDFDEQTDEWLREVTPNP